MVVGVLMLCGRSADAMQPECWRQRYRLGGCRHPLILSKSTFSKCARLGSMEQHITRDHAAHFENVDVLS